MIKEKFKSLLSFTGISLIIGIVGGIFGLITPFIDDWNTLISLKWFLFIAFIFFIFTLALLKVLLDIRNDLKDKKAEYIRVIRYVPKYETFIISKNDSLGNQAMVSVFYLDENYEVELGKGYVENIQENLIQIKVLKFSKEFVNQYSSAFKQLNHNNIDVLKKIIVKSYIRYNKN
jgi:hypothetical protein